MTPGRGCEPDQVARAGRRRRMTNIGAGGASLMRAGSPSDAAPRGVAALGLCTTSMPVAACGREPAGRGRHTSGPARPRTTVATRDACTDRSVALRRLRPMSPVARPTAAFFDLDKTIIARSSTFAFSKEFQASGLISRGAVLRSRVRAVRLPRRRRRPRPDGEDARVHVPAGQRLGRADRPRHRRRHAAQHRRAARVRRGGRPDRGAPRRGARRDHRVDQRRRDGRADRASCSVRTTSSPPGWRSPTASTPARSASTPTRRTRPRRSPTWPASGGYDLDGCYAYSDSMTDVHMLEIVGHPFAVNPDKELRRIASERGWPVLVFERPVALAQPGQAASGEADARGPRDRRHGRSRRGRLDQRPSGRRGRLGL